MNQSSLQIKNYAGKDMNIFLSVSSYTGGGLKIDILEEETANFLYSLSLEFDGLKEKNHIVVNCYDFPYAENFIKNYDLGQKVCEIVYEVREYPVYEMDMDELREYDPLGVKDFLKIANGNIEDQRTVWDALKDG